MDGMNIELLFLEDTGYAIIIPHKKVHLMPSFCEPSGYFDDVNFSAPEVVGIEVTGDDAYNISGQKTIGNTYLKTVILRAR